MFRGKSAAILAGFLAAGTASAQQLGGELANPIELPSDSNLTFVQGTVTMPGYIAAPGAAPAPVSISTRYFQTGNPLLVGPTIRISPGGTQKILLNNTMTYSEDQGDSPAHPAMSHSPYSDTLPHGFDIVNLHTHGLHVSPKGHSDNVLLNLFPADSPKDTVKKCDEQVAGDPITKHVCAQGAWETKVTLPAQHPSGTYWYHTHKHGAVALHLASGLAGALIVQDPVHGLESLPEVKAAIASGGEKIMVIQDIGFITGAGSLAQPGPAPVNCAGIYGTACIYGTTTGTANTQLSVNGQFNPVITLQQNQVQLWRVVNATPGTVLPMCLSQVSGQSGGTAPSLYVLAADGTPVHVPSPPVTPFQLGAPVADVASNHQGLANNEFLFLAAGQRLDLMVQGQTPGLYALLQPAQASATANAPTMGQLCPATVTPAELGANQQNVVAFVNVVAPTGTTVATQLPTQVELNGTYNPASVVGSADLPGGPTQGVMFGFTNVSYTHAHQNIGGASIVNGRPFYEGRIQRHVYLNEADLWGVQSAEDTHMFHIHTNPFQLVKRGNVPYPFPIWRDTAMINCASVAYQPNSANPANTIGACAFPGGLTSNVSGAGALGEVLQFASRAVYFDGAIVMHCHNVNHEDNGMMELVEISKR